MLTLKQLQKKSTFQLDRIFRGCSISRTPRGSWQGHVLFFHSLIGHLCNGILQNMWQGMVFFPGKRAKQVFAGQPLFLGTIKHGKSLADNKLCVVIEYANRPLLRVFRHEIREVTPKLYLVKNYVFGWMFGHTTLDKE